MNTVNKIEQGRAEEAFRCVQNFVRTDGKKKEYKSYSKKIPMLIKTNGLAATFAFMNTKKPDDPYIQIGKDIVFWLQTLNPGLKTKMDNAGNNTKLNPFLQVLLSASSEEYKYFTAETLSFMNWHRRFTEGMIKDNHGTE